MRYNNTMKVNLHITEACNYRCRHCFAKFDSNKTLGFDEWKQIIDNCLRAGIKKFNLAGGEPFLHPDIDKIIDYIYNQGAECSIITNGSLLKREWILQNGCKLSTLGVSIDSVDNSTNCCLGRCDSNEHVLDLAELQETLQCLYEVNPDCDLKINTVVSRLNKDENISVILRDISCDRWKLLKIHHFHNGSWNNSDLLITDEEFKQFLLTNVPGLNMEDVDLSANTLVELEDGVNVVVEGVMTDAYLIVDARGCLVNNFGGNYTDAGNLLSVEFSEAMKNVSFNAKEFWSRYDA